MFGVIFYVNLKKEIMKNKKDENIIHPIEPDLKHDTMEFAASTDGDDQLDPIEEEDDITADELNALDYEPEEIETKALNTAVNDSKFDEDNFLSAGDEPDEFDEVKMNDVDI